MAGGYLQVPHELLRSGMDPILLRVYLVIASYADAGTRNECTAARDSIAEAAGCSVAAVKRSIGTLRRLGWVDAQERNGRPSILRPMHPRDVNPVTDDTNPGHTDPGSGHTDPTPGSHRPDTRVSQTHKEDREKKTERRRQKKNTGKTIAPGTRRQITDSQKAFLEDLVLLLDLQEQDPADLAHDSEEADEVIADLWSQVEHAGRREIADAARNAPGVYERLSPRGQDFVDREGGRAA